MQAAQLLVDRSLARRLERAEAAAGAKFVDARAHRDSASGAEWTLIAGAYALYDGPSSPVTQTFGLGLFDTVTPVELERIEAFYRDRGSPIHHEVSPLAGTPLHAMLAERQYAPVEFTSVMFRDLRPGESESRTEPGIAVRIATSSEADLWARTAAQGWSDSVDLGDALQDLMLTVASRDSGVPFLVERNGDAIAAGTLCMEGEVALLAGASTIPSARKLGAQKALLDARLRFAADAGCDIAMICAEPGSASQRNAERRGFRIAYTRIKWKRL